MILYPSLRKNHEPGTVENVESFRLSLGLLPRSLFSRRPFIDTTLVTKGLVVEALDDRGTPQPPLSEE